MQTSRRFPCVCHVSPGRSRRRLLTLVLLSRLITGRIGIDEGIAMRDSLLPGFLTYVLEGLTRFFSANESMPAFVLGYYERMHKVLVIFFTRGKDECLVGNHQLLIPAPVRPTAEVPHAGPSPAAAST